jgi:hypothetical protein
MSGNSNPIALLATRFGGISAMARAVGCPQQTVQDWVTKGHVPSQRIPGVIKTAAKLDPPVRLRPADFFPAEVSADATA